MRVWATSGKIRLLGSVLIIGLPLGTHIAGAATLPHTSVKPSAWPVHGSAWHRTVEAATPARDRHSEIAPSGHARELHGGLKRALYTSRRGVKVPLRHSSSAGGISCVPYAREVSGIELKGNAANWWDEADGVYARGNAPEPGSVLNFRANASMHLGHVAVVSNVISSREIEIDHANWWGPGASKGGISRNISVIDVSPNNDWTAVRVGLGHTGDYGSIYPTYGFIYDRQEGTPARHALMTASSTPVLNQAPRDLRTAAQRAAARRSYDEVAEIPVGRGLDLSIGGLSLDAPDRSVK